MRCPHCGHSQSRVIETREADDAVRRRRRCEACELRFTTYERPQFPRLVVRGTSGSQRNFTRAWLAGALHTAGAALPAAALKTIAGAIEAQLRATSRRVVSTADIALLATREVGLAQPRHDARESHVTAEQVTAVLDATLPSRRAQPSQLSLPIDR